MTPTRDIGAAIRRIRQEQGLEPESCAKVLGVQPCTWVRYEWAGVRNLPLLEHICDALEVDLIYLIEYARELGES